MHLNHIHPINIHLAAQAQSFPAHHPARVDGSRLVQNGQLNHQNHQKWAGYEPLLPWGGGAGMGENAQAFTVAQLISGNLSSLPNSILMPETFARKQIIQIPIQSVAECLKMEDPSSSLMRTNQVTAAQAHLKREHRCGFKNPHVFVV